MGREDSVLRGRYLSGRHSGEVQPEPEYDSPLERYDPDEHDTAVRIGEANPQWHVMWGSWSRRFWAYPHFAAPRGTLVSSPDPGELIARMRSAEVEASFWQVRRP